MIRSLVSLLLISFVAPSSFATTRYIGMSNYGATTNTDAGGVIHVYAGHTSSGLCLSDTENLCDSCTKLATAPIASYTTGFSCNSSEINPDLKFHIQISSDQGTAYPVGPCVNVIAIASGSTSTFIPSTDIPGYSANSPNQVITASFRWGDLCANSSNPSTDCSKSFNTTYEFAFINACGGGISSKLPEQGARVQIQYRYVHGSPSMTFDQTNPCQGNTANIYENACNFALDPGDEKAYIRDGSLISNNASGYVVPDLSVADNTQGTTTDASGMTYSSLRFFFSDVSFNAVTTANGKDVPVSGITASDPRIGGLENGKPYYMVMANVDQGGNVTFFSNPGVTTLGADQTVTPQPVFGMLDGKSCFVATAAYGSPMAEQVEGLRQFRNHFLLKTSMGKDFVRFYYAHSPAWAAVIAKSEFLRATTRGLLAPVVYLSDFSLHHHLGPVAGSLLFALGLFISFAIVVAIAGFLGFAGYWSIARVRALRN